MNKKGGRKPSLKIETTWAFNRENTQTSSGSPSCRKFQNATTAS